MMKIAAIITLYDLNNIGNRLQNYALQQIIRTLGFDTVSLSYWEEDPIRAMVKRILKKENHKILLKSKEAIKDERLQTRRYKKIRIFDQKYIKSRLINGKRERLFKSLDDSCDFFIAGSDQIWNPLFWSKRKQVEHFFRFFLCFTKPEKRISYAASFGINALPQIWEKPMAAELAKFEMISVRENSGAMIVKKLIGKDVPVVLDPTLLLTAPQWRTIATGIVTHEGRYVATYFLGKQSETARREIHAAADAMDAKIIDLMDNKSDYYFIAPDDFISIIDHAQAVFTDSFHGTVFSILFHKSFRVFSRFGDNSPNMSSRIDTLLEKTQLTECVRQKRFPTPDEFHRADTLLEQERKSSMQFLKSALKFHSNK